MKRILMIVLALVLALHPAVSGEGMDVQVDAFVQRAGIEADAAMREKIAAFMRGHSITARILDMMDDALLARYARCLAGDIPIDYRFMLEDPSLPMPEGAQIRQLAVLVPDGAVMPSMLADFERGLVYYDEAYPVPEDVCMAEHAAPLSEEAAAAILKALEGVPLEDHIGEMTGVEFSAIRVAVAWQGGVTRCMAGGEGVPQSFLDGVRALLELGGAAALGDNI